MHKLTVTTAICAAIAAPLWAENRIDGQSPDAPELAAYGDLPVGVRRYDFVNPDQIDIVATEAEGPLPTYDRPLPVEVWYPAAEGATGDTSLDAYIRDGETQVELFGRVVRDAAPAASETPFPLLLLSHGYPGNRFLLSHLGENLASKGYVVASIDHTDSTYRTQSAFGSTLVNRPLDQLFVLDEMARLGADPASDLAGLVDADNAGLIGYSMGGYGAIITAGGGVTEESATTGPYAPPQGTLGIHVEGTETQESLPDPRIKTAVAIGPWGRNSGFFDDETLDGIGIPMLFIAGSDDSVSLYEAGVRAIWEEADSIERALLTFEGGGHNTVAPIPAPEEAFDAGVSGHYTDDVWDTVFMNNVGQHFVTAWMDLALKGDESRSAFLDLPVFGSEGWTGFGPGDADGLRYETLAPVPLPASILLLGAGIGGLGLMRRRRASRRA